MKITLNETYNKYISKCGFSANCENCEKSLVGKNVKNFKNKFWVCENCENVMDLDDDDMEFFKDNGNE